MTDNTTPMNTPPDPISANAFLICPKKGAAKALKVVKNELKAAGCHWQTAAGAWSCPMTTKETTETLLAKKHIGVTLTPFQDDYFCKSERGQEAEKVWTQIDILEKRHYAESTVLLVDRTAFEREIEARGLLPEDLRCKNEIRTVGCPRQGAGRFDGRNHAVAE